MKIFCLISVLALFTMHTSFTAGGAPGGGTNCGIAASTLDAETDWGRARLILDEQLIQPLRVTAGTTAVPYRVFTRAAPSWPDRAPQPMLVRGWELIALGPEPKGELRLVRGTGEQIAVGVRIDVDADAVFIDDAGVTLTAAVWLERFGPGLAGAAAGNSG